MNETTTETKTKPTRADVLAYIASLKTWLTQEHGAEADEAREGVLRLATRDHGDVGDEKPGQEDLAEAGRVGRSIRAQFPTLRATRDVIDEWVDLDISGIAPVTEAKND